MAQQISEFELVLRNYRKITDAACITYFLQFLMKIIWKNGGRFILPHHGGTGNRKKLKVKKIGRQIERDRNILEKRI